MTAEKHEWSWHYDNLQWIVTTILTAAIGGLFVYLHSTDEFTLFLALLGIVLTLASVFIAASFRALRRQIHESMSDEEQVLVRSRIMFKQWPAHLGVHLFLLGGWIYLLIENEPEWKETWISVGLQANRH